MNDKNNKLDISSGVIEKVLGLLSSLVPALLVYIMDRSKNRADSLESELDLKKTELKIEKDKEALDAQNSGKSNIDIVNNFIDPGSSK